MGNMISKDASRAIILIFLGIVLALWVYTNFDKGAGEIYIAMGIVTLLAYRYSHELYNHGKEVLIGIDDNIGTDIVIGGRFVRFARCRVFLIFCIVVFQVEE